VLAQRAAEQLPSAVDRLVEVDDFGRGHLVPGEGQELAGHPDRLLRGHLHLLDVGQYRGHGYCFPTGTPS
jgi:hypothetical protein